MKISPASHGRTLTTRGASTRQRIVDVTATLIYAKGVEATSLDDVCKSAGVSKSQLYHYFADKDELVREIITTQSERVLAAQAPALDAIDSFAGLRRWAEGFHGLYRRTGGKGGCPLGSLASELANQSEPARDLLVSGFEAWAERLAQGFERMRVRGELLPAAEPKQLALAVVAAVQGGLLLAKTVRNEEPLRLALEMAIEHVEQRRSPAQRSSRRTVRQRR